MRFQPENNARFPDRRITVRTVAIDHGIMHLVGAIQPAPVAGMKG